MVLLLAIALHSAEPALAQRRTVVDRLEASVNGQEILRSDVQNFRKLLSLRSELDPLFAFSSLAQRSKDRKDSIQEMELVNYLIDDALILQSFPIHDSEVEQEIATIQAGNKITRAQLEGALQARGFAFKDYRKGIEVGLAKRNLIDREIRTRVSVSEDDIRQHYFNTRKDAASRFTFKLSLIRVTPSNFKTPQDALETARRALREIRDGQPFADVARKSSDDPSSGSGGDLGYLSEGSLVADIKDRVRKMKVGEVSEVLGSPTTNYWIVKLEDVQSAKDEAFIKEKDAIRGELSTKEFATQVKLWLQRRRSESQLSIAGQRPSYSHAIVPPVSQKN